MEKENTEILKQISNTLDKINARQEKVELLSESNRLLEESNKLYEQADRRVESSLNQIQNSFDRVHDKIFNFNNILIGATLVLGTFPDKSPILSIWTVIFPILNLVFLVYLDIRQMEIHRFAAKEQEWTSIERDKHGRKIRQQTLLSLLALLLSLGFLVYLIVRLT